MRFIIPSYELPDNFTENVAVTLRNMGHEVLTAPVPVRIVDQRVMHLMQLGFEKFAPGRLTPQEKWLLKMHKQFKPQVMLALTQAISEATLLELRAAGVKNFSWWGDTPANMRNHGLLCYGWDIVFIKDKYAVFKMKTLGINAHFLPEAMNPIWHKKNFEHINGEIVFAGNTYEYRHFLIRKILDSGWTNISLYGNKPPRWADPRLGDIFRNKFVVREEKSRVFGEALACINSTSMTEGNSINCRTFEIAGAGGLQIMEYRSAIEDCFEPEKEILTFRSVDELIDKVKFYQLHPEASMRIREAAQRRVLSEHTYEHRLREILKFTSSEI